MVRSSQARLEKGQSGKIQLRSGQEMVRYGQVSYVWSGQFRERSDQEKFRSRNDQVWEG